MTIWQTLRSDILETFTPGPPINEVSLFAGRKKVIQRLQDTVFERARHAIIYGERGVGKTSLANVFHKPLNTPTRKVEEIYITADTLDSFDSLWRKVFRRISFEGDGGTLDLQFTGAIEPDHVIIQLSRFSPNALPVIIIDEYDRIEDADCRTLMTDTIKGLANIQRNPTVILVGVADDILKLVADHASISRNLIQVPMTRMIGEEVEQIVVSRVGRLNMKISEDAVFRIKYFSAGLPFYAHSLGKFSALKAVGDKRLQINEADVVSAIDDCMADVDHTIAESYIRATEPINRKGNMFKEVLAACALAEANALGEFTAAAVEPTLTAIMGRPYKAPAFVFALNEMCGTGRGLVFEKTEARRIQYKFREPSMQPYIVMKSLKDKVIDKVLLERFTINRQREFPI